MSTTETALVNTRRFAGTPEKVFGAFSDPRLLAKWWGPDGFTNTIREFDFRPGGAWKTVMHGPDGTDYENESEFVEISAPDRVDFIHLGPMHRYRMVMTFAAEDGGTRLTWDMRFDDEAEAAKLRNFILQANEQNFDRLGAVLAADA